MFCCSKKEQKIYTGTLKHFTTKQGTSTYDTQAIEDLIFVFIQATVLIIRCVETFAVITNGSKEKSSTFKQHLITIHVHLIQLNNYFITLRFSHINSDFNI